jgi:hypothetical protein
MFLGFDVHVDLCSLKYALQFSELCSLVLVKEHWSVSCNVKLKIEFKYYTAMTMVLTCRLV